MSKNLRLVGHSSLEGHGNGGQVTVENRGDKYYAFVGHMKDLGTSILDVTKPKDPRIVAQIPVPENTHSHKVRVSGDLMFVNRERIGKGRSFEAGLKVFDISEISTPVEIGFFETGGKGVHRFWLDCEKKLAYISTEMDGYLNAFFMILDFSDPRELREVSRWWFPGQWVEGGEEPTWDADKKSFRHHHPVVLDDRAYLGYWDGGFVILDISDIRHPRMVSRCSYSPPYGGAFHTALPVSRTIMDRRWLVVFQESTRPYLVEGRKLVWIVDITAETNPVPVATFQVPPEGFNLEKG
ncbi:MAG: hypothetical protein JSW01_02655, partial [Candidatus Bathyarchaeota archaeon]